MNKYLGMTNDDTPIVISDTFKGCVDNLVIYGISLTELDKKKIRTKLENNTITNIVSLSEAMIISVEYKE